MLYQMSYEVKSVRVGDIGLLVSSDIEGTRLSSEISPTRTDLTSYVAHLVEHWTSIPKVAGSISTVVRQTFQLA